MLTIFVRSYVEFTDLLQDHATERKRQLLQSLRHLRRVVAGGKVTAALLGGDLNIRDEEAKENRETGGDGGGPCWIKVEGIPETS